MIQVIWPDDPGLPLNELMTLMKRFQEQGARIAKLEAGLRTCIEWAASDCEHEACKGVIDTASKLVQPID